MKDSGVEWIGEIPKSWGIRKLKYILKERKEKNNPITTKFILSLSVDRGVFPYTEKTGGGNKAKEDLTAYKVARPNDIVINSMNILAGSVGISKWIGAVSPVYYTYYSDSKNIDIKYYNFLLQSREFQKSLLGLGNGIMMKESGNGKLNTIRMRIPSEKLNSLLLPIPSGLEQRRIADFLDKKTQMIDEIIVDTKQSIVELKAYKQSIITEAVTKGLDPNVEMKDSGVKIIGKIPAEWNVIKLGFLGSLQNGISKSSEYFGSGFPFVSYGDVYNNRQLISSVNGLVNSSAEDRINYSVKKGDIFFTRTSETIREVGMTSVCLTDIPDATFAGFLIRFRPTTDVLLTEFAEYYFQANFLRDFFAKEMNLVIRASLSQPLLKRVPVLLPDIREQRNIVNFLNKKTSEIDELLSDKEQLISEYESYKKSLIYEYVTGKKQVK